jgi:hypothetical protein
MWALATALRPGTVASLAAGVLVFVVLAVVLRLVTKDEVAFLRAGLTRVMRRR